MAQTTDVILGSTVLIVGTSVIKNARNKTPAGTTFKPIVFGFGLAFALLAIAIPFPGLARALAYMGMVGAFIANGPAIFEMIGKMGS